jgi:hypothetical protein
MAGPLQTGAISAGQLIPIYSADEFQPASAVMTYVGNGATASTLPFSTGPSGSAQGGLGGSVQAGVSGTGASGAAQGSVNVPGTIAGLPGQIFWVLALGFIAYVVLWKVHFHGAN